MLFSKQISDLKASVEKLEGQLNAANGNVSAISDEKTRLAEEKTKLEARISELEASAEGTITAAAHEAALKLKDGKIAELEANIEAAAKNVEKKVIETIASAGVPAVKRDPAAVDNPAKTTAANGTSPRQRLAGSTKIAGQ